MSQSLKPAEIIVCDDASTDGTAAILEKYNRLGHITYYVNESRLGVIGNFKKAVKLTNTANYVALSDQDDEWLPDKLEKSIALLKQVDDNKSPCIIYTDLILVDQNDNILNRSFHNVFGHDKYKHNLQSLLFTNFATGCTIMMNTRARQLFIEMPDDIRSHDEWLALIAFSFGKAKSITTPLVRYRKHESNVSMAPDTKPGSRYRSTLNEIIKSIKGNDDFLMEQFEVIRKFYEYYYNEISADKKPYFEEFLKLKKTSYFFKKLAFRKMVRKFKNAN